MSDKKKSGLVKYLAITAGAFTATFVVIGEITYHFVLSRKGLNSPIASRVVNRDEEKIKNDEYRSGLERIYKEGAHWFKDAEKENISIYNRKNQSLHANLFRPEKESDVFVICIHGYTSAPWNMGIYVKEFLNMGYNVITPSLRGHADSEEEFITMGRNDRLDVIDWINYIVKMHPDCKIILHGVSMGAATTMMTVGEELPENVKLAIEDCGYTNVWDIMKHKMSQMKIPEFPFLYSSNDVNRRKAKFGFKEASCTEQLKKCKIPMLFIHGENDDFVPYSMLDPVFDACPSPKEKLSVPDAPHARSVCAHPELYWPAVTNFINKYL